MTYEDYGMYLAFTTQQKSMGPPKEHFFLKSRNPETSRELHIKWNL